MDVVKSIANIALTWYNEKKGAGGGSVVPQAGKYGEMQMNVFETQTYGKIKFNHSVDEHPVPSFFGRHCHRHYEIIYVVQGAGKYVVEGERYELKPDTLMFFRPGEFHYVDIRRENLYERYVFHFFTDDLPEIAGAMARLEEKPFGEGNFYEAQDFPVPVLPVFEKFSLLGGLPEVEAGVMARLLLAELLVLLSVSSPVKRVRGKEEPLGARVIRYLNGHIAEPLSLEVLSKNFYVSKYYLCRAFKEHNGISILGYLNGKRVMLARQMIESGEVAAMAAERVGFGDYSTFYRAYRKAYGAAPTQNRQRGEAETK